MTDSTWKVIVDGDSLTITSDAFSFSTKGTDPSRLEGVLADLQSALRGTYGQYCGLSRAAEMVGERWGFLIVRDLLVGPKTVAELCEGLPLASPPVLSRRLKELAYSGVVRQVEASDDHTQERYELTEYGRASEDAVLAFGRWGAATLAMPRPEDIVTDASLIVALKATFLAEMAVGVKVSYELTIGGHVLNARIDDGVLEVGAGPLPGADSTLDLGFALRELMTGEVSVEDAIESGQVRVEAGDTALLHRFVSLFQLPKLPAPQVPTPKVLA